jgi:hypothetical protein
MELTRHARRRLRPILGLLLIATTATIPGTPALADPCDAPGCDVSEINAWADELVELIRGPIHYDFPAAGNASWGNPLDVLGAPLPEADEAVSLGDGGSVIVGFDEAISNGADYDFAVFENGITSGTGAFIFMELGFVEVSSDGVSFARFPSLTSRTIPVGDLEEADPDDYANLASNVLNQFGTGFDLADLLNHPLVLSQDVDLNDIHYIRVEDVVGNGTRFDSMGSPIYDPFPTPFNVGGFDLKAVGAIHVPEAHGSVLLISGAAGLFVLRRRRRANILGNQR